MSFLCTIMGDTVGVVWRAATGTVDPWTKNQIVACETASLQQAGACAQGICAASTAHCDVTCTLKTYKGPCCKTTGADPSQALCGLKNTFSNLTCLSTGIGKTVLFIGIGALLLLLVFNYATRRQ